MAAEPNENIAHRAVESFLIKADRHEITRIELYYRDWISLALAALSEYHLQQGYDCKVIIRHPDLSAVVKSLKDFKFLLDKSPSDFKLGCVFYEGEQEVLRIFFANNAQTIAINGTQFKMPPQLITVIMQFLPFYAYQEVSVSIKQTERIDYALLADQVLQNTPEHLHFAPDSKFSWCFVKFYEDDVLPELKQLILTKLRSKYTVYLSESEIPGNLKHFKEGKLTDYEGGFSFTVGMKLLNHQRVRICYGDWEGDLAGSKHCEVYEWTGKMWKVIEKEPMAIW
jgi:hypothetical protein